MGIFSGMFRPKSEEISIEPDKNEPEGKSGWLEGILTESKDTDDSLGRVLSVNVYQCDPKLIPSSRAQKMSIYVYLAPNEYDTCVTDDRTCKFDKIYALDESGLVFGTAKGAEYYQTKIQEAHEAVEDDSTSDAA